MFKFVIKCPKCGTVNQALKFAKNVTCGKCGEKINIKDSSMSSRICPYCNDTFVYDQRKGKITTCPSCGKEVDAFHAGKFVTVNCPQCACPVEVEEHSKEQKCPVCNKLIEVQKELARLKLVNSSTVSVLQYEGDNSTFVWKHPIEDFNTGTQLIVHESQEAVFFMNGQALDTFGPGRHTLETENLPILKNLYNVPTGSQTPFHAEVYFINKTVQFVMKWGTDSRVRFIDPSTNIPLDIGACGELTLQVSNARKLLSKIVGTTGGLSDKQVLSDKSDSAGVVHRTLQSYFRAPLMTEIKSYLANVIKIQQLDILEIDNQMSVLSEAMKERIVPKFEEYGLTVPNFYITYISLPEDDPNYQRIKELRTESVLGVQEEELKAKLAQAAGKTMAIEAENEVNIDIIKAKGDATKAAILGQTEINLQREKGMADADVMRAKGYTGRDVLEADVQKEFAKGLGQIGSNSTGGSGDGANIVAGIMSAAAGIRLANTAFDKLNVDGMIGEKNEVSVDTWTCTACKTSSNKGKFCENCGEPKPEAWTCKACGHIDNKGKFCENCGASKPVVWTCPNCKQTGNTGKCCPECGTAKP